MRTFALKTQFGIIVAFLLAFALGASVSSFLQESRWIREREAGRLSPQQAAQVLASRSDDEDIREIAQNGHDVTLQDLRARMEDARRASRRGFLLVLCIGLIASAILAFIISRYIIEPIHMLDEYARGWKPGQPWACRAPAVSPEINSLFQHMKDLMEGLNAELRKQQDIGQLKSQLVSTVSHELNNSLSVIHAVSVNLEETDPHAASERRVRMYRILKGQALTLSRVISNLLNLGRLESGKLSLEKKEMDIQLILKSGVELMEILIQNKRLQVSLQTQDLSLPVYADPEALTLVVTNLLSNAIKYTPEGGSIVVGCENDRGRPGHVRVYVKDTGIGVSPDDRERIFSGHYRSKEGQMMAKGFGIGLSLAKSIVEAHGGRMDLESEPGRGSKFFFLLPLWNPQRRVNREMQSSAATPPHETVQVNTYA